ncbi:MAG TPA: NACHT domain-containing protein [Roseiflexaceae bacterium]|nr:NACHT domain-containing protein [Roseiflexaceae bacterium]
MDATPVQIMLSVVFGILANYMTSAIQPPLKSVFQRRIDAAEQNDELLRRAPVTLRSLREELDDACNQLMTDLHTAGLREGETPIWLLLSDARFQDTLAEWLVAGGIEEGSAARERLLATMAEALAKAGADPEQIERLRAEYLELLEKQVFASPILREWRHQRSLDYLRGQIDAIRATVERNAGIYTPEERQEALDRYCTMALGFWDILELSNLPEGDVQIATQQILLRRLYMPLRVQIEVSRERADQADAFDMLEQKRVRRRLWEAGHALADDDAPEPDTPAPSERVPTGERLAAARRLVVLGDPGGGKTTLLRWMATAYLLRYRADPMYDQLPDVATLPDEQLIPVLIRCRDLGEDDLSRSFDTFLAQHLRQSELRPEEADVMRTVILEQITHGRVLLLIDGLDEITRPDVRARFCQQIERTAARYPDAPIVVTSRIVGYRDMPYRMGAGFEHSVIAELIAEDKDLFAQRWTDATEQHLPARERQQRAEELRNALHSSDRIERLTGNPMLLTTLALVKRKVGKLPSRRHKLYAEAVSVLLRWNPPPYHNELEEEEALPQLAYLAYEMCHRGVQRLTEDEVLDLLYRMRDEYRNIYPLRNHEPKQFLVLLEARSSILIKSGGTWQKTHEQPVWEFRHLTFQEYLAARALREGRYPGRDRSLSLAQQVALLAGTVKRYEDEDGYEQWQVVESWQETLRLLVVDCKDDDIDDVLLSITELLPNEIFEQTARARAVLAVRCLADEPNVREDTANKVLQQFLNYDLRGDEEGLANSLFEKAASEIGASIWWDCLKNHLLSEFFNEEPEMRLESAGLLSFVSFSLAPQDDLEFENWCYDTVNLIDSESDIDVTLSALTIHHACFTGRFHIVENIEHKLLENIGKNNHMTCAIMWALFWLTSPHTNPDKSPFVKLEESYIEILDHISLKIPPTETDTLRFLIHVLRGRPIIRKKDEAG